MNIGINARRLAGQRLGIGRYLEYLLKYWEHLAGPGDLVRLYVRRTGDAADLRLPASIVTTVRRPALTGALWENLSLLGGTRDDVLFCPSYTAPLIGRSPVVVAIHSTNEVEPGAHDRRYAVTYGAHYRLSAARARRIIVPSETTKRDIVNHYGTEPERVTVIPQGVDDAFRPVHDPKARERVRRRYFGDDRPFILFVGKLSTRRNIPLLLEALAVLKHEFAMPHGLLLVGPNYTQLPLADLARQLGIEDRMVHTDGVFAEHRELVEIYGAADVYVNASLYEGWSLTMLEAMACGVPVVSVKRGALGELAGDAALLVDEASSAEVAKALRVVITNRAMAAKLTRSGSARASQFTWKQTATATWNALQEVAGSARG